MPFFLLRTLFVLSGIFYLTACGSTPVTETPKMVYPPIRAVGLDERFIQPRELIHFDDYVLFLKGKALTQGVSEQTLHQQQQIQYVQSAVDLDHKQAGIRVKSATISALNPPVTSSENLEDNSFAPQSTNTTPSQKTAVKVSPKKKKTVKNQGGSPTTRYLRRVITSSKLASAKSLYQQHQPDLKPISQQFNVPSQYIVALWGMESTFGRYQGKYDVLSVLATLAFEGRRENLFSREFVSALKMLDQKAISREKMRGSWAGAMGQTQFMPSSYLRFAVDADQDEQKDIWHTHQDVFASVANYLSTIGWQSDLTWGVEVITPRRVIRQFAGTELNKKRSLKQWQKLGVKFRFAKSVTAKKKAALMKTPLWLVSPDSNHARTFLVTNNYRTLLHWNRSHHFALSVGMFAEQVKPF